MGYIVTSLMVSTAFSLAPVASLVVNRTEIQPNIYAIFIGPPSTVTKFENQP